MRLRGLHIFAAAIVTLLIASSLRYFLPTDTITREQYILNVESAIQEQLEIIEEGISPVLVNLEEGTGKKFSMLSGNCAAPYFIYKNQRLFFWSDHSYVPRFSDLQTDTPLTFHTDQSGMYLVRNWNIDNYIDVVVLVPLFKNYSVENSYISPTYNNEIFGSTKVSILATNTTGDTVFPVHVDGQHVFSLQIDPDAYTRDINIKNLSLGLFLVGFMLLLLFLYVLVRKQILLYNYSRAFLILVIGLMTFRAFLLLIEFPSSFSDLRLFDSVYFVASALNPSLGDFLINVLIVLTLLLFLYQSYYKMEVYRKLVAAGNNVKLFVGIVLVFVGLLLICVQYLVFQSIYTNSQISLDISSSLSFDSLRIVAFAIFVLNATIFFLAYHMIFRIVTRILDRSELIYLSLLLASLLFVPIAYFNPIPYWSITVLNASYFLLLYLLKLPRTLIRFRYNAYVYLFVSAMLCSIAGSIAIERYEGDRSYEDQERFVNQFLVENDRPAEYILSQITEQIQNDVFISRQLYNPFFSKEVIGEKIRRIYLPGYLDRYNISVNLYNANGDPISGNSSIGTYGEIFQQFANEQYATDDENIYFVNRSGVDVTKRYLVFIPMQLRNIDIGYILLDLELKKLLPNTVYPELLVDTRFLQPFENKDYSYAVYTDDELTYNTGSFNYAVDFDPEFLDRRDIREEGFINQGWRHIAGQDADQRLIVVSTRYNAFEKVVSNFSFLFLLMVFIILLFIGLFILFSSYTKVNMNYAAKIQLNLNLAFFTPLFIVSIIILGLISQSLKNEIDDDHEQIAEVVGDNIIKSLDQYLRGQWSTEEFSSEVSQIAKVAGIDISIFNKVGRLIVSSQPLIYQYGILSNYINPEAMIQIIENGKNSIIVEEQIGNLSYDNTYVVVKSFETGNIMAVLSVPFFGSGGLLEQEQISVFTTIINIFSVVFIIFLGISYFVSKWLILPLNFITQKIKRTTLTDNEAIEWNSDDEIGLLVNEYNRMLVNLEANKRALARSEKESAWREMAKQVAHEIKNPLTPMKLTLQQLQRTTKDSNDQSFDRPIRNLLHQIDTLSDIATSFSSFAKMPIPENERFDLASCVRKTLGIYKNSEEAEIVYTQKVNYIEVLGDEQLTGRIISNIIINSLQSKAEDRELVIKVLLEPSEDGNRVHIAISDNGVGIPEEAQSKVFVPNFSTKETGSGIGLAIAKHGIEHAGGTIWFESDENGTTFHIELPVVK